MQTFLVGGAVRDIILNKTPKDRDYVVIGETPESMVAAGFEQVGKDFPVFLHPETKEEYALARRERKTGVGYNGFECDTKDVTLEEDLGRRDFTMNSIAMDSNGNFIDPYGGIVDISFKIIRHTSDAFSEDPLRVIRLLRFYSRYDGFGIAPETDALAQKIVDSGEMESIPTERYWLELQKVLECPQTFWFFRGLIGFFNAHKKVTFFKKLFNGNMNFLDVVSMANQTTMNLPENRLDYFAASLRFYNPESNFFPTNRSQKLAEIVGYMMDKPKTVENYYNLLLKMKVFNSGSILHDVLAFIFHMGDPLCLMDKYDKIAVIVNELSKINAAMFPEYEGVQLGNKIKEKRLEILESML